MNNKKVWIISAVAVLLVVAIILFIVFGNKKNNKNEPEEKQNVSSSSSVYVKAPENSTSDSTSSMDEIIDDGTGLSPDESKANAILRESRPQAVVSTPVKQPEPKKPEKKEPEFKQDANPDTGVSWDGKSKIVYRTANGDTTEKTYGGYYEKRPGEWVLLEYPTEYEEWSDKCPYCGRVSGDGTNGTCLRYSLVDGESICPNCHAPIPADTCHSCGG